MSVRYVTHVARNDDGNIIAVCHPGEPWSPRGRDDAIHDIETGEDTYYTAAVPVKVVHGAHGKYLRTVPDKTEADNLNHLPDAPPVP